MPGEIELSHRSTQYEGGENPKPRKMNPMEKQREKHKEKIDAFNIREASTIGEHVINLSRTEKTDPAFCVLLVVVFLATIGLAVYGFTAGGTIAYAPVLSDGTVCGHGPNALKGSSSDQDAINYPYLYFPVPKKDTQSGVDLWDTAFCVKTCPKEGLPQDIVQSKKSNIDITNQATIAEYQVYETRYFGLVCRPTIADATKDGPVKAASLQLFGDIKKTDEGKSAISALNAAASLGICMVTAGILSLLYIYAMANFATCIAYTVIAIIEFFIIGFILTGFAAMAVNPNEAPGQAAELAKEGLDRVIDPVAQNCYLTGVFEAGPAPPPKRMLQPGNNAQNQVNPGIPIVAVGLIALVIFNLVIYCKWKQIKIAIAVVDATADFFVATKRINFVSIWYFLMMGIWTVFWVACLIAMSGVGEYKWTGEAQLTHQQRALDYPFEVVEGRKVYSKRPIDYMMDFMKFSYLWIVLYIKELNIFVLMASVSTYYFDSNSENNGSAQVMLSMKWAHVTHTGSIALGSFIHTILLLTVYPLMKYADSLADSSNPAAKCLGYCLKCALKCIEELVEYLNKVAYAYMAITGNKYCSSAWNGFLLNIKHIWQFYLTIQLAEGFVKLGVFMIVLSNIAIFTALHIYAFNDMDYAQMPDLYQQVTSEAECTAIFEMKKRFTNDDKMMERILGSVLAYVLLLVITFLIIEVFLGLFDEAIVSTLHCMACDMELNDGRPKYGPPSFHDKMNEVLGNPDLDPGNPKDPEAHLNNPNDQTNMPMNAPPQGQPAVMMQPGGMGHTTTFQQSTTTTTTNVQVMQ